MLPGSTRAPQFGTLTSRVEGTMGALTAGVSRTVEVPVNPSNVAHMVGRDERVYEVVDRQEDLMKLVQAVKEASRARATR